MTAVRPGWRSLEGLAWLARVGACSSETWATGMRWAGQTVRSHTVRLERAELLARVSRPQGHGGPLLYATPMGVQLAGVEVATLRKPPAPASWAHNEACAQVAAYLTLRGREMRAPRELLIDQRWVGELEWVEHGDQHVRRRGHRPDFVATIKNGRSMAIEVELTAKSAERLRSVLAMYARWLADGRVDSLLYVVGGERERRQLLREAPKVGLERGQRFGVQLLETVRGRMTDTAETQDI